MHIFSESAFVTLGKLIEKTANLFNIPGLSCAIVRSGQDVNYLNVGTVAPGTHDDLPVTENTIFKIGSISKSVLGTALGILETKGLLDLSKDIADLLELDAQEKEFFRGVTPLHILTHTSGVAAFSSSMQAFLGIPGEKIRQSLSYLPKRSSPGDKFQYHNGLYWLLAELVEKTTGSKWRDWITQAIFERLDMKTTGFAVCPKLMAKPFCCYQSKLRPVDAGQDHFSNSVQPAAGLYSSAADLVKWLQFHMGHINIDGKLFATDLLQNHSTIVDLPAAETQSIIDELFAKTSYGRGHFIYLLDGQLQNKKLISFVGGLPGYSTIACFEPKDGIGMVFLCNQMNMSSLFLYLAVEILRLVNGKPLLNLAERIVEQEQMFKKQEAKAIETGELTSPNEKYAKFSYAYSDRCFGDVSIIKESKQFFVVFDSVKIRYPLLYNKNEDLFIIDAKGLAFSNVFPKITLKLTKDELFLKIYMSNKKGGVNLLMEYQFVDQPGGFC